MQLPSRTILFAAALIAGPTMRSAAGQYAIDWYTIDCGGVMFSSDGQPDGFELSGTIGQPDAGVMSGGTFTLVGGFWVAAATGEPVACGCGDLDGSGLVDLLDFTTLATCFGLASPSGDCTGAAFACADLNGDGAIDLVDFSLFSNAFGLPAAGSPPDCQ